MIAATDEELNDDELLIDVELVVEEDELEIEDGTLLLLSSDDEEFITDELIDDDDNIALELRELELMLELELVALTELLLFGCDELPPPPPQAVSTKAIAAAHKLLCSFEIELIIYYYLG